MSDFCDPMDCSHQAPLSMRILQARILEWVAMPSFRGSFQPRDQTLVSCVSCSGRWIFYHCATWEAPYYSITMVKSESEVAQSCLTLCDPMDHQAPPSMGFSRQEYWSGLPFPSPGDLPDPGIKPRSPALQADSLSSELPRKLFILTIFTCFTNLI